MHPTVAQAGDHGAGLWSRTWLRRDGTESGPVLTNLRIAGAARRPGSLLVAVATGLLFGLGLGLLGVSLAAQYRYVFHERHQHLASITEALALDVGMVIFSLLALGLARAGKSARVERVLITACAAGSAVMNYAAANDLSPRSILAFCMPPVFLAAVTDRVIAVVRRHMLGDDERSPWAASGRGALYLARFLLAPPSTVRGLRRALLNAVPLPEPPVAMPDVPASAVGAAGQPAIEAPAVGPKSPRKPVRKPGLERGRNGSKTSQFLALVAGSAGPFAEIPLADVYRLSIELAPKVDLDPGSARTALRRALLAAQEGGDQR
jgi:hypothetical protein